MKIKNLAQKLSLVIGGDAGGQVLRLASNLVLTRLLVPEMFGLMAIVSSIITGLALLTDVGLRGSVINEKNLTEGFLGTVWSTQVARSILIFLVLILIASPLETFLELEGFSELLLALSFTTLINGFNSINILIFQREIRLKPLIVMQLISQVLGIITMITLAYFYRTVWSLVAGAFATSLSTLFISHLLQGEKSRFKFDINIFIKLINFGKWILVSTFGVYLTMHADKLIYSKYLSLTELGVLTIAFGLGNISGNLAASISTKILQPLYSSVARDSAANLHSIYKLRLILILSAFVGCFLISLLSDHIVMFLYDDRYKNAGWMLKVITFGSFLYTLDATLRPLLISNNDSYRAMKVQLIKSIMFIIGLISGLYYFGLVGGLLSAAFLQLGGHYHLLKYVKNYGYIWYWTEISIVLLGTSLFLVSWYLESGIIYYNISNILINRIN